MNKMITLIAKLFLRTLIFITKLALLLLGREAFAKRKEAEKVKTLAQQEAQYHMNEFVSVISHDLKTPLTSIKGNLQLMGRRLRKVLGPDPIELEQTKMLLNEARELLERTDQQVNRLTRVINSLLESSRINANTMDLLFELCELNSLVCEVVQDKRYTPTDRTIHIELPEGKTILVMGDVNRLKQVLSQYLSNAHKYSQREHPIAISLHEDGAMAQVEVHDQGQGIPPHEHQNVWERYYRVPGIKVLTGSEVGLGLGLYICRTIIEQHKGKVGLKSIPGEGSTFWFALPLAENNLKGA